MPPYLWVQGVHLAAFFGFSQTPFAQMRLLHKNPQGILFNNLGKSRLLWTMSSITRN